MISLLIRRWAAGATVDSESLLAALREACSQVERELGKAEPWVNPHDVVYYGEEEAKRRAEMRWKGKEGEKRGD